MTARLLDQVRLKRVPPLLHTTSLLDQVRLELEARSAARRRDQSLGWG